MNSITRKLKQINFKLNTYARDILRNRRLRKYLNNGRQPWSSGYSDYKEAYLKKILDDKHTLDIFRTSAALPEQFGYRLDERAVEYPWLFSRIDKNPALLLDAGSALNFEYLLNNRWLSNKSVVIYNLSPEKLIMKDNISYIYGDLRQTILKDEIFDLCVCISTLEHVGMDNQMLYSKREQYLESSIDSYLHVIKELKRILKPDGRLYITVPYGTYEHLGWLQQFDKQMVADLISIFDGQCYSISYFGYENNGWQFTNSEACKNYRYFDIHREKNFEIDLVAAARAVACIEIVK